MSWGALLGLVLSLNLLGALDLPKDLAIDGAPLGGISGVDYDRRTGEWLMISDDRSAKAPARFFVGRLDYDARGVKGLRLVRQIPLRREDGSTFPGTADAGERADAEALRIDPQTGDLVWSREGDAPRGFDPAIGRMDRTGRWTGTVPSPPAFGFDPAGAHGARLNQTFEGLSFSPDGRWLWLAMEGPLIQDGPASSVAQGGLTRITRLDRTGRVSAQYAYRLDPIQAAPARRGDNGISEILAVDDRRLLVLERSGVEDAQGRFSFHCRLYLVDIAGAQDVAGRASLAGPAPRVLTKRLLVNFDRVAGGAVNLEAMAWGASLAGRRTLVLMADDNFSADQAQRVLVFLFHAPRR
ncbi:esterase-like activity of phytase family protein [Caulobacter sp.]|uniref:esterase-like activity of phytase family protein n=1 Tax=Caulobacter sp. TaxID=78 RepID=UPI003BAFF624